jgi:hypothetical protein
LDEFGIIYLLEQEESIEDFSEIPKPSRPLLVSINRPPKFQENVCLCLCLVLDSIFFLEAWQVEKEKNMVEGHPAPKGVAKFLQGCWCSHFQVTMV